MKLWNGTGTDEIARITATRDRILATLTDEGERAQVTAAYEQQLKDLHDTVEAAKLDKSKGISLATTQLNKEAKEESERLKTEETATLTNLSNTFQALFTKLASDRDALLEKYKNDEEVREKDLKETLKQQEQTAANDKKTINDAYATAIKTINDNLATTIKGLQNAILANEQQTTFAKKVANEEFANAAKQLQIQVFENEKQLMIAQLKTEVAVLEAKKTIFNDGSITAAQNKIIDIINGLIGQSSGISPVGGLPEQVSGPNAGTPIYDAFTADGKRVTITYSKDHDITVYDANKNEIRVKNGIGYIPETGQYFAKGTESVDGPYKDGIDTVPAWLTKGERVLTVEQNKMLGGISNEELVQRNKYVDTASLAVPNMQMAFSDFNFDWNDFSPRISMPESVRNDQSLSEFKEGYRLLRESVDASRLAIENVQRSIEDKKLVSVNIDRNGFALSEEGSNNIVHHYSAIIKRS